MSLDNLKEYARRCATEPELRDKAKEIGTTDADAHMRHAESLGLEWSRSDLALFRKEVIDSEEEIGDIAEEDLENIAGGAATLTACVVVSVGVGVAAGATAGAAAGTAVGGAASAAGDGGW